MATCSLRFYKRSQLKPDKNWCFDNIETYLASLTYYDVSNYQYQRFELDKEIRVDFTQSEQTISPSADKYDYLRISTVVNNAPIYYYYFIIKTRQVSESTIAYQLRMDTLNTFKYDSTAANNKYTLSPKTLVKREHKDRMHKRGGSNRFIKKELTGDDLIHFEHFKNGSGVDNAYITFMLNVLGLPNNQPTYFVMDNYEIPSPQVGLSISIYKNGVLDNIYACNSPYDSIYFDPLGGVYFCDYDTKTNGGLLFFLQDYNWETDFFIISLGSGWSTWKIDSNHDIIFEQAFINRLLPYTIQNMKDMLVMDVDEYQEGLSTILFKKKEISLADEDGFNQWYVVYASSAAVVTDQTSSTEALYINPVQVRFYSDNGYTLTTSSSHEVRLYATDSRIPRYKNSPEIISCEFLTEPAMGTYYVKLGGITYDFHDYVRMWLWKTNNSDTYFSHFILVGRGGNPGVDLYGTFESIIFYGINTLKVEGDQNLPGDPMKTGTITINSGSGSYSGTCSPWSDVDLTDSRLIKAFAFPYAPCEFLVGENSFSALPNGIVWSSDNVIEMDIQQTPLFNYQKLFEVENPQLKLIHDSVSIIAGQSKNIELESKLLHSDYYQPKVVYDSFSFTFNLEDINTEEYLNDPLFENLLVGYVISQNIQSKFMFTFPQYVLKRSRQDYDNVLCIERNNEKALFNNSFINYIRSGGYSYDTKKASSQNAVNGITTALSAVAGASSFAAGMASANPLLMTAGVGLAVSATTGIIRSVHTAQEQDRAISQKIMQAHMQGTSVQGSEDIDILTAFSGNKAKIVYYELSDIMKSAMYDLFFYCGYATHEQKIPDVTTRLYFNFVQAEIVFDEYNFNEEIADDIQNKWNEGVTFFHAVSGGYDIGQQYENFETSLM